MKLDKFKIVIFLCLPLSLNVSASLEDYYPKKLEPTSSNSGITGILEMPNARFMDEGSMKIGFSSSYPNEYTYISATPFSWLEASYKYTEQKNLKYAKLKALEMFNTKQSMSNLSCVLSAVGDWVKRIILKQGWRDGKNGFTIAKINAKLKIKRYHLLQELIP